MKKADFVIIGVSLLIAGILYFCGILAPGDEGGRAVVFVDGNEVISYSLEKDGEYIIEGINGKNTLVIKDCKAEIVSADCPDKVCVNHVPIYRENESIICLPHKVVIEIEGGQDFEIDAISQ